MDKVKITKNNYFDKIGAILKIDSLPETLSKSHLFVLRVTGGINDWTKYNNSDSVKRTVDLYFDKLTDFVNKSNSNTKEEKKSKPVATNNNSKGERKKQANSNRSKERFKSTKDVAKNLIRGYVLRGDSLKSLQNSYLGLYNGENNATIKGTKIVVEKFNGKEVKESFSLPELYNEILAESKGTHFSQEDVTLVESFDEDVKQIRKFVGINDRIKTSAQILNILKGLQRAITGKLISKAKSRYVKEIERIQEMLIRLVDMANGRTPIKIETKFLNSLVQIVGGEKIYYSITLVRSYIGMQGKQLDKEKIESFISRTEKAFQSGKISEDDPYLPRLKSIISTLKKRKGREAVAISKAELNGLMGIIEGCGCGLNGIETIEKPTGIINSMDFVKMQFQTLGFKDKWLDFIGDPEPGFTAMISGKPKFGKSYLCIDFAGYLARNHGKVLYVAKEEALNKTLQSKVIEKAVQHPNLELSDSMPDDFNGYQFVFLDSVTALGLTSKDLSKLESLYPHISFIYIFHVRKDGVFRGTNDFQHNVDVVIEVPDKGNAIQFGRFNQGGEMQIFDDENNLN